MSLGQRATGLRARRRARSQAAVELTPLIDIVFQLLIFFLLTATFQNNPSFRVKLPKAKNNQQSAEPKALVVTLSPKGTMEIDGKQVDARELEMRLCKAGADDPSTRINIRADEETMHQYVVTVMDVATGCGLKQLGIVHSR